MKFVKSGELCSLTQPTFHHAVQHDESVPMCVDTSASEPSALVPGILTSDIQGEVPVKVLVDTGAEDGNYISAILFKWLFGGGA